VDAERPRPVLLLQQPARIAQQYVTNRIIGPPVVRPVRAPAERKLKRAGGGKTEDLASGN